MRASRALPAALLGFLVLLGEVPEGAQARGPVEASAALDDDEGEADEDAAEPASGGQDARLADPPAADEASGADEDDETPPPELHRVRAGETWGSLARRHRVKPAALRRLNPELDTLRPGARIRVPGRLYPPGRVRYPLTSGPGYLVHKPERAFGTRTTVSALRRAFAAHHARFPQAPPLYVHDLSKRGGGRLRPHRSHRTGRDVDIWLPLRRPTASRRGAATAKTLHLERTWFLVRALVRTGAVEMIFLDYGLQRALFGYARAHGASAEELSKIFEYPKRRRRGGRYFSVLNHERGHRDHLHVRFRPDRRAVPTT